MEYLQSQNDLRHKWDEHQALAAEFLSDKNRAELNARASRNLNPLRARPLNLYFLPSPTPLRSHDCERCAGSCECLSVLAA